MANPSNVPDSRIIWPSDVAPKNAAIFAQHTIDIAAPAEKVWALLIDCKKWPSWYKYCSDVSVLRGGERLASGGKFRFKTLDLYFEPEITGYDEPRMLVWSAKGPIGSKGAHGWYIQATPNGCRVVTEEAQAGLLPTIFKGRTSKMLDTSHSEWLRALKERAEGQ